MKGKKEAERGIQEAGAMSPEESAQYQQSFALGNLLEQIFKAQQGLGDYPSGYKLPEQQFRSQGDLADTLYQQTYAQARDPEQFYQSTLNPQLQIAEDYINRKYAAKGLIRSGLPIEQMGRAGVELAVQEADKRMGARAQALSQAAALQEYISGESGKNLGNLAALYSSQQAIAQPQRAMQAQYQAYPYQAQLGDVYGRQAALYALPGQAMGAAASIAGAS